jgi:cytochrome P450
MTAVSLLAPPASLPVYTADSPFGVARSFTNEPLSTLTRVFESHGDIVKVRFFANQYFYLLSHPDYVRHVFATNADNYTKAPHPAFVLLGHLMGKGLVTSDGPLWLRQRRLVQPAFTKQRVAGYGRVMTAAATRMLERWEARPDGAPPLNVDAEMMRLTLEIVGQTLFSLDIAAEAGRVGQAFSEVSDQFAKLLGHPLGPLLVRLPFLPSIRRFNRNIATLDEIVEDIIAERRRDQADRGDLLSLLVLARDEATGEGMDDRQLRDEVMTLMLSGHETTADALTWTFYLLDRHPDVRDRLEAEVDAVLGAREPGVEDLPRLPYTKMVVQEALRLYPPIFLFARWGHAPDTVAGHELPADANVMVCPWVLHRHPEFWPEAERFDPERFEPAHAGGRHPYAWMPFGGGPRQCLGVHFALMEAQLLLATIVARCRLRTVSGHVALPGPMMTLRPRGGMPMCPTTRLAA